MSQTIAAFSTGFEGKRPSPRTVHLATPMVRAARGQALEREFYVDDTDGALGVMIRLKNGLLMLAELSVDGTLSGSTYNDSPGRQVEFFDNATPDTVLALLETDSPGGKRQQ